MDKEQKAIERLRAGSEMSLHFYGKPLTITYSGGKDSEVLLELTKRSEIPFEVINNHIVFGDSVVKSLLLPVYWSESKLERK